MLFTMTFQQLVERNRSYRRFREERAVPEATLRELVELARHVPSGMNRQPLKYVLCCGAAINAKVFETVSWAGSLKDWDGPEPGERPAAYIVVLTDTAIKPNTARIDIGIASQTILLGAVEKGLGGCMLGSARSAPLARVLDLDDQFEVSLVIALGEPAETVVLEDAAPGGPVTYYREPDGTHHVPKRTATEIIVGVHTE